ncbi:NADH dehydrogenase [ubiquinone] complex I, assembly factor 7 [Tyrophagus putrescentiae]|nr:NADH dehydrogenase [ubiquinone] complex I, assembly factor 7 [Tyrophagus putrescentiae]
MATVVVVTTASHVLSSSVQADLLLLFKDDHQVELETPEKSTTSSPSSPSPRSPLLRELLQRIQWSGPLTVAEYMKTALTHPRHGFYTASAEVFGSRGHFTTSPEVSALFGEMVAVWVLYEWQRRTAAANRKSPLRVVELGPGRGFLTSDVARVLAQFEAKQRTKPLSSVSFHLVEISDRLRAIQERNDLRREGGLLLEDSSDRSRPADQLAPLAGGAALPAEAKPFTVFLANEYFDAFPVHKFVRSGSSSSGEQQQSAWREVLVDMTPTGDALRLIQARHPTPASQYFTSSTSNEAPSFRRSPATTTRSPGAADLTADVDFAAIGPSEGEKKDVQVFGTVTQEHFLRQLGIGLRLQMLLAQNAKLEPTERQQLVGSVRMLLEEMGRRFRVMAVFAGGGGSDQQSTPVGFEQEKEKKKV